MRHRIKYIESNVKNAGRVDFETPCVFLGGPHEAGKTAFVDALHINFSQAHPVLGKQPADLLLLAPNHAAPLITLVGFTVGSNEVSIHAGTT